MYTDSDDSDYEAESLSQSEDYGDDCFPLYRRGNKDPPQSGSESQSEYDSSDEYDGTQNESESDENPAVCLLLFCTACFKYCIWTMEIILELRAYYLWIINRKAVIFKNMARL